MKKKKNSIFGWPVVSFHSLWPGSLNASFDSRVENEPSISLSHLRLTVTVFVSFNHPSIHPIGAKMILFFILALVKEEIVFTCINWFDSTALRLEPESGVVVGWLFKLTVYFISVCVCLCVIYYLSHSLFSTMIYLLTSHWSFDLLLPLSFSWCFHQFTTVNQLLGTFWHSLLQHMLITLNILIVVNEKKYFFLTWWWLEEEK